MRGPTCAFRPRLPERRRAACESSAETTSIVLESKRSSLRIHAALSLSLFLRIFLSYRRIDGSSRYAGTTTREERFAPFSNGSVKPKIAVHSKRRYRTRRRRKQKLENKNFEIQQRRWAITKTYRANERVYIKKKKHYGALYGNGKIPMRIPLLMR